MFICQYCKREYSIKKIFERHQKYCLLNPNKIKRKGTNQYTLAKKEGRKIYVSQETRKKMSIAASKQIMSRETKKKISDSRIKFLKENPDMVPYRLNHYSKGESYPEKYFSNIFDIYNIEVFKQYPISIYQLDFAILDKKIDIEIDGEQHYTDKRIIESDKRRNEFLYKEGWKVIRIRWSHYQKLSQIDKENFIKEFISKL